VHNRTKAESAPTEDTPNSSFLFRDRGGRNNGEEEIDGEYKLSFDEEGVVKRVAGSMLFHGEPKVKMSDHHRLIAPR